MFTCSGKTTITLPSGVMIILSMPKPCGRWGQWPREAGCWDEGGRHGKEGCILACLCPALGPGGAGSAQGHHGAAEDEPGLMWHRLGHRQEVYLCCLFPPGSKAQGEPVGAVAPSWPDICTWAKFFLSLCTVLQIWASPQVCQDSIKGTG